MLWAAKSGQCDKRHRRLRRMPVLPPLARLSSTDYSDVMQRNIVPFPEPARVPPGLSIIAFGDVHGHLALMEEILTKAQMRAAAQPERRHVLISLGDLVDRGPDSAGVVARLMGNVPGCELVVLRGNHETLMLAFLAGSAAATSWLSWGGLETLESYGVDTAGLSVTGGDVEILRQRFQARVPPAHVEFLRTRPLSASFGDYFFVHAGARPGIPLAEQVEHDLIWIRDDSPYRFEKRIVHGHTPVDAPRIGRTQINIDTGACYGGMLTAMLFEDAKVRMF
jgi:serine/threonine protein phosphatase 1